MEGRWARGGPMAHASGARRRRHKKVVEGVGELIRHEEGELGGS